MPLIALISPLIASDCPNPPFVCALEGELLYRAAEISARQIASLLEDRANGYSDDDLKQAGYSARVFLGARVPLEEARLAVRLLDDPSDGL